MKAILATTALIGALSFATAGFAQSQYGSGDVTVHPAHPHHALRHNPGEGWNDGTYGNIWREGPYFATGYNYGEVTGSPGARPANGNGAFPMLPSSPVYAPSDQGFPERGMGGDLLHSY